MSAEGTTVWERTAEVLIEQVSDTVWSSTFQDIQVDALHDDVLTLAVPSQLVRQRIEAILGLDETVPVLGYRVTINPQINQMMTPDYYVLIDEDGAEDTMKPERGPPMVLCTVDETTSA